MSRYGDIVCFDCRCRLWLGKAIFKTDGDKVSHFHIGDREAPRNSEKLDLNRALWKFLADHASHSIHVVVEGMDDKYDEVDDEFVQIGGRRTIDLSFQAYTTDWNG